MEELKTTRTLEVIGAEIRTLTASMLGNIIEIGRRMAEAKTLLEHGAFMPWIEENTGYSQSTANNFMRLFEEYGDRQGSLFGAELSNSQTFGNLSYSKALALLALPSGERESFAEANDIDSMTTRELKEAIRRQKELETERDAARKRAEDAEASAEALKKSAYAATEERDKFIAELGDAKMRIRELEARPVEVAVEVDEEAVKKASEEARKAAEAEWGAKLRAAEDKLAKAKKAAEKAKNAGDASELDAARAETEQLRADLETAKRQAAINSDADALLCREYYSVAVESINKLNGHLRDCKDEQTGEKIRRLLADIAKKAGGDGRE